MIWFDDGLLVILNQYIIIPSPTEISGVRITEDNDRRITEDGNVRVTEGI